MWWWFHARPEQLAPPGDWITWVLAGGRGSGKGQGACEWLLDRVEQGLCRVGALANRTTTDVRSIQIEGAASGLIVAAERRGLVADYVASHRKVYLRRGQELLADLELFSAVEPDGPRGRNLDTVWADELGAWAPKVDAVGNTCWTNLTLALRAGDDPRACVSTTPKPTRQLIALYEAPTSAVTTMSLFDNRANLAQPFVDLIVGSYAGTRLAAQEIEGILTLVVEGALFTQDNLNDNRWAAPIGLRRAVVVGVDPPAEGGEAGVVVAGAYRLTSQRTDAAILADYSVPGRRATSWANMVAQAVEQWDADAVIVESNQGGAMARSTLAAVLPPGIRVVDVKAKIGKAARAEPVAILAEQGRLHIVGDLPILESQLTGWAADDTSWSPDRLDAAVHAVEYLRRLVLARPGVVRRPQGEVPGVRNR